MCLQDVSNEKLDAAVLRLSISLIKHSVHYRIEKSGQFLEIAIVDWLSIFTTEKNEANFWV